MNLMELKVNNLTKKYGRKITALDNVNMTIEAGILGLLGPNGAGKSTLMKIIATIIKPTEGKVFYNGVDINLKPRIIQKDLGYLPQDFGVYDHLNIVEFLEYIAVIKGMDKQTIKKVIPEILEIVNLHGERKRLLETYSGGMKQRVGIAQTLINSPKVLIVDEPTVGLDPDERQNFKTLLSELSKNRIVIFSTHIVTDVQGYANHIAIMNKGYIAVKDKSDNLLDILKNSVWQCSLTESEYNKIKNQFIISESIRNDLSINCRIIAPEKPVEKAETAVPTLQEVYLYYTHEAQGQKEGV